MHLVLMVIFLPSDALSSAYDESQQQVDGGLHRTLSTSAEQKMSGDEDELSACDTHFDIRCKSKNTGTPENQFITRLILCRYIGDCK